MVSLLGGVFVSEAKSRRRGLCTFDLSQIENRLHFELLKVI